MESFILAHKISKYMKNSILFFFLVGFSLAVQAQSASIEMQEWTSSYEFTTEQTTAVEKIVTRKYRNLAEIEPLQTTDATLYKRKQQGIVKQTKQQVRRLMSKEQTLVFDAQEQARKDKIREEVKAMLASGTNKDEISKLLEQLNY